MSDENPFYTARVHCCVCHGSGKVPKLVWWKMDCSVCEGTGERVILLSRNLTPADRNMVVQSAILGGANYRPHSQLGNIFGFPLF